MQQIKKVLLVSDSHSHQFTTLYHLSFTYILPCTYLRFLPHQHQQLYQRLQEQLHGELHPPQPTQHRHPISNQQLTTCGCDHFLHVREKCLGATLLFQSHTHLSNRPTWRLITPTNMKVNYTHQHDPWLDRQTWSMSVTQPPMYCIMHAMP